MATTGQTWEQMCREAHVRFQEVFAAAQADPESPFARAINETLSQLNPNYVQPGSLMRSAQSADLDYD
jgi:hypothetical protein